MTPGYHSTELLSWLLCGVVATLATVGLALALGSVLGLPGPRRRDR